MNPRATLARAAVVGALAALAGCASQRSSTVACADGATTVVLPRWTGAAADATQTRAPPSYSLTDPVTARDTVRIVPEAPRDPVDDLLRAHRGGRRIRALALREAPVTDTLRMFAEIAGLNVVFADEVQGRTVTINLRDVSLGAAFRAVLRAAHLGADVVGGEILEVRPQSVERVSMRTP